MRWQWPIRGASKRLVEPELNGLYRTAFRLTRNRSDAEDLVQETCIRACRQLSDLREDGPVRAWLLTVLHNLFVDGARRAGSAPIASLPEAQDPDGSASPDPGPEELSVFEIGLSSSAENRAFAWFLLGRGPANPEFVPTLLDDLANHSDTLVQSNAVSALGRYVDDPDVRAALERAAAEDTAERVQGVARALLDSVPP